MYHKLNTRSCLISFLQQQYYKLRVGDCGHTKTIKEIWRDICKQITTDHTTDFMQIGTHSDISQINKISFLLIIIMT